MPLRRLMARGSFAPAIIPGWAAPDLDDSAWESIAVDKSWGAQSHFGYTGFAWYRRHLTLVPVAGANTDLALFLPPIDDAYELYWNGKLIGQGGKLPPHPVWYWTAPYLTFGIGQPRSGVLAIRVWKAPYVSFDSGVLGGLFRGSAGGQLRGRRSLQGRTGSSMAQKPAV